MKRTTLIGRKVRFKSGYRPGGCQGPIDKYGVIIAHNPELPGEYEVHVEGWGTTICLDRSDFVVARKRGAE